MPTPNAQPISLSDRQRKQLEHIASHRTNAYRLVTRAKVILGAAGGINNTELSQQLQLHRRRVRMWRQRWLKAGEQLAVAEQKQVSDKHLRKMIESILSDAPRPGTPKFFSVEQAVQIVAIACEAPEQSKHLLRWKLLVMLTISLLRKRLYGKFPLSCCLSNLSTQSCPDSSSYQSDRLCQLLPPQMGTLL